MQRNNRLIITGIPIILLALGVTAFFYIESGKEYKKIASLKEEIAVITAERDIILKKIEDTKEEKDELALRLQDYSKQIQDNESEIEDIKRAKEGILSQLQAKEDDLSGLRQALEKVELKESMFKDALAKAKIGHENILKSLESAQKEKTALEEKIKSHLDGSKGIELRKIVVKMANPITGKVIDVNREYNFAVINLGIEDDISSGDILGLYRKDRLIAKAMVENVYEDMSSVMVFDEWRNVVINQGDAVKLLEN